MAVLIRRMTKRSDFVKLKTEGLRVNTQAFVLQYQQRADVDGVLVGFTTSGALGNAVKRNRARRRLKAAFDTVCRLNKVCVGGGQVLVIVGKVPIFGVAFEYLCKDMAKALGQAGLTC